jgi:hypothetical protein
MLNDADLYILAGVSALSPDGRMPYRELSDRLGVPIANLQRSFRRLEGARLVRRGRRPNLSHAVELFIHGAKYIAPAELGPVVPGVPTAWAAAPLRGRIADRSDLPPVWPALDGDVRGRAVEPLHKSAVEAAAKDQRLAGLLALIDALRVGDARVRENAEPLLEALLDSRAINANPEAHDRERPR